jgi:hypothetical protein
MNFISTYGLTTENKDDSSDTCIKHLDKWIEPIKKKIHEKHIKGPSNTPVVLQNFINNMGTLHNEVCLALREPDVAVRDGELKRIGWPDELIECTKDTGVRTEVKDRLKLWCKTFTLNSELLTDLKQNNEMSQQDLE